MEEKSGCRVALAGVPSVFETVDHLYVRFGNSTGQHIVRQLV
jgi:hypothetical protein